MIPFTHFFKARCSEIIKFNFWAWLTVLKSIQTQENQRFRHFSLNSHAKKLVFWPVTCLNIPLFSLFQSMMLSNNQSQILILVKKGKSVCRMRKWVIRMDPVKIRIIKFPFSWPKWHVTGLIIPPYLIYQCHMKENTKIQIMIMVTIHWGSIYYGNMRYKPKSGSPM